MQRSIIILILVSLFGFMSCDSFIQDETGVPEQKQLFKAEFQNGNLPDSRYSGCSDTYIISGASANTNYDSVSLLTCGKYNDGSSGRILLYFNMESYIPYDAEVEAAYLYLFQEHTTVYGLYPQCYDILTFFEASTATWNSSSTGVSWATAGAYFSPTPIVIDRSGGAINTYYKLNASDVQKYLNGTPGGILLKYEDEASLSTNRTTEYYSSEYSETGIRPKLVVYYTLSD